MSWPAKRIVPPIGVTSPARVVSVVVLPAPLAPSSATISPGATCSETSRIAGTPL